MSGVIYGDGTLTVELGEGVIWRWHDGEENGCLLISRHQMNEIVRGYEREKEQERDGTD